MARSAGIYQQSLLALLHGFKYKGKIQLARPLAAILFFALRENWCKDCFDLVVPVPLHRKKLKQRGFNQVSLMIREWDRISANFNLDTPYCRIDEQVLARRHWTQPQTGLGRKQRIANIKNAFQLKNTLAVAGKRILLVDDVYTTGATVNECAGVLAQGGTESVDVLTLARAI
jgi:ComF family protein